MANATSTQLQELYVAYFGRAADPTGLDYWTESGITTAAFAANMYAQPEFKSEYGSLSIESQVNQIYKNLFDRDADVTGLTYWSQQIRLGNLQLAEIANDLIWAAQNNSGSASDKTALSNRSSAAVAYTAKIKETTAGILAYQPLNDGLTAGSTFAAGDNITAAKTYLATIDKDTASTAAGIAASVSSIITTGVPAAATASKTLTLVTTQDSVKGGDGNDTINGVIVGAAADGTTIQAGDVISGGAGTDTLAIAVSGSATHTLSGVQVSGVEKVLLTNFDAAAGATTVDTVLLGGPTTVGLSSSSATGDTIFTGMTALTNAEMKNGTADLTLTHASSAVSGSSDEITLGVLNATAGVFTAAGIETLTIDSTFTASTLTDVVAANLTTLKVTGSANVSVADEDNNIDFATNSSTAAAAIDGTVDASAFTGNLDVIFNTGDVISATGGSGADTFNFTTGFDKYDVVNGGAGTDTLVISQGAATLTKTELANVTGIEKLAINTFSDSAVLDADGIDSSISTIKTAANTILVDIDAALATAGNDLSYVLNGTTYTIATADATETTDSVAVELAASITAIDGFTATTTDVDSTTDGLLVTATTGDVVNISAITDTSASAAVTTVYGDMDNVSITNIVDQTVEIGSGKNVTASLKDASGTADTLNINLTSNSVDKAIDQTIAQISASNIETINLNTSGLSANTVDYIVTTLTDGGSTDLNTLNITGSSSLDLSGTITATDLTTVNAATFTGDLKIDGVAEDQSITTGTGADEIIMGANLNNSDTINGGAGTDTLTATNPTTAWTSTTGALSISNVETINITNTGTQVIDATNITGATELAVAGAQTSTTITGLAAGLKVGVGFNDTDQNTPGLFDLSLADATGSADALTINLNDTEDGAYSLEVKATGIETVTFDVTDDTDTNVANATIDVDSLNASSVVVTGGTLDVTGTLSLGTLDTDTTSVTATGYGGVLTATAGSAIATTFDLKGDRAHVITGSSKNDTFTMGDTTGAAPTIDGVSGTDVLNITLGDGVANFDNISNIDTINISVTTSADITTNAAAADVAGLNLATAVNVTGGNSLSSINISGANSAFLTDAVASTYDFSGYNGVITDLTWAVDDFDNGVTGVTQKVVGTSGTSDTLSASYDAGVDATAQLNMQGIETFDVDLVDDAVEMVFDMSLVTGLTQINLTDASAESAEFSDLAAGVTIDVTSDLHTAATRVEVKPATVTGVETQAFNISAVNTLDEIDLVIADVETVTIKTESANTVDLDLSGLSMTTAGEVMALNFTGIYDVRLEALGADVTTLDASGMGVGGAVIQTGRSATAASTYTGSAGADTLIMMSSSDAIAAGAGSDTLDVNYHGILGGLNIDLNATNQLVTIDGGGATGTITGFVNVDASGYTGGYGARITGLTTATNTAITGTGFGDVITTSGGNDTITGTAGADVISTGAGDDNLTITAVGNVVTFGDGADTLTLTDALTAVLDDASNGSYDGGDGSDTVSISDASTAVDAEFVDFTNMEILDFTTASSTATLGANFEAAGFTTIDVTGASLALTTTGLGSASSPIEITGYAFDNANAKFITAGGTKTILDAVPTGWTAVIGGMATLSGATVATFFTAAAATCSTGDTAGFISGSDTFIFGEGASTAASDDVFLKLTGVTATAISATAAATTVMVA